MDSKSNSATYSNHERVDHTKVLSSQYRRMDSLAKLLKGSDVCSAVCFDGEKILISSNRKEEFDQASKNIISFLQDIASQNLTLAQMKNKYAREIDSLAQACAEEAFTRIKDEIKIIGTRKDSLDQEHLEDLQQEMKQFYNLKNTFEVTLENNKIQNDNNDQNIIKIEKLLTAYDKIYLEIKEVYGELFGGAETLTKAKQVAKKKYINSRMTPIMEIIGKPATDIEECLNEGKKECFDGENIKLLLQQKLGYLKTNAHKLHQQNPELLQKFYDLIEFKKYKKCLEKLVSSLAKDSNKRFDIKLIQAFQDKSFEYIGPIKNPNNDNFALHAEMSIIEKLNQNMKLGNSKNYYIGISRLCCGSCTYAIKNLNEKINGGIETLQIRGEHGNFYPNWVNPPFFKQYRIEACEYKLENYSRNKEEHNSSDSEPEIYTKSNLFYDPNNNNNNFRLSEKANFAKKFAILNFNLKSYLFENFFSDQKSYFSKQIIIAQHEARSISKKLETTKLTYQQKLYKNGYKNVWIFSEDDHMEEHSNQTNALIKQIQKGKIATNTVIALERKQLGNNLGMKDVILLANLLKQDEISKHKIQFNSELRSMTIYNDALLYKQARDQGIKLIGIEGKNLTNPPLSNNFKRENYMIKLLDKILYAGNNLIIFIGNAHIANITRLLEQRHANINIQVSDSHCTKTKETSIFSR